jgi:hypothetical protein
MTSVTEKKETFPRSKLESKIYFYFYLFIYFIGLKQTLNNFDKNIAGTISFFFLGLLVEYQSRKEFSFIKLYIKNLLMLL